MTNAELFKQTFGRYATDVWSLPEDEFLEWLNADVQQKMGRWMHPYKSDIACECSECHIQMPITNYFNYCPNCGEKMVEPQKREES